MLMALFDPKYRYPTQIYTNNVFLHSDTPDVDFEVAEFTVDGNTRNVLIDMSGDLLLNISLSVRSTTTHWPALQLNEAVFDLAFYIAGKFYQCHRIHHVGCVGPLRPFRDVFVVDAHWHFGSGIILFSSKCDVMLFTCSLR